MAITAAAGAGRYAEVTHEKEELVRKAAAMTGGDVQRGEAAFSRYGCGGCHAVKGVPQASGTVGPPLDGVAVRAIIGGRLENKPANLQRWIVDPQSVSPGTAMPRLGVTPADARDISAFLYTRT
ncbi:c-type cytochrome [Sphingomonas parva]|uniref:c-type cytochrome n=1 Tax=Sphingomonas parva TaxID=2555898 RepID=UPI001CDBB8FD|nr:c-type cytochrome [Sphingomonas parva]